jgi:hypothetical protein
VFVGGRCRARLFGHGRIVSPDRSTARPVIPKAKYRREYGLNGPTTLSGHFCYPATVQSDSQAKMAQKPRSQKTQVVEYLFDQIKDDASWVVMLQDVSEAIEHCNKAYGLDLSTRNPANFMKDLVRGKGASLNWPQSLKDAHIGGRQRVGGGRVFEFVRYAEGQTDPFESSFVRGKNLASVPVQSISMPLTAKSLGRMDESWLIQVAVGLRVIETHFATRERASPLTVLEIVHLQTGVKLATSEVDAVFVAVVDKEGTRLRALITCEAKQASERILDHQIVEQVVAANKSMKAAGVLTDIIIPIAIQASLDPPGCIYLAEFEEWTPTQAEVNEDQLGSLVLVAEGLYQLTPPVPGVGLKPPPRRSTK